MESDRSNAPSPPATKASFWKTLALVFGAMVGVCLVALVYLTGKSTNALGKTFAAASRALASTDSISVSEFSENSRITVGSETIGRVRAATFWRLNARSKPLRLYLAQMDTGYDLPPAPIALLEEHSDSIHVSIVDAIQPKGDVAGYLWISDHEGFIPLYMGP